MTDKPDVASNGMQFSVTFLNELGLSPYSVLEAAWVMPALIMGCRDKLWTKTYQKDKHPPPIVNLWLELNLISTTLVSNSNDITVALTEAGTNIVSMSDLFEYEFSMMQQQLDENYVTEPEKYRKLRKALSMYSDKYLSSISDWMNTRCGTKVLDFGGGEGYYLGKMLDSDSERNGVLYDKAPNYDMEEKFPNRCFVWKSDFRDGSTTFFESSTATFDTIIFSEVLHCISINEYPKVLHQLASTLAENGELLIVEQRPSFRMDWRLDAMTAGGESLELSEVVKRLQAIPELGLEPVNTIVTATHYAIAFKKVK